MIRYYPLFKHQFKNMKLLMLVLPVILGLFLVVLNSGMKNTYINIAFGRMPIFNRNLFYSLINFSGIMVICIIWTGVVCAVQSANEKRSSVGNFISYLPYKRTIMLLVRILTTVCFYTVCLFVVGVALLNMRNFYFDLYIEELYRVIPSGQLLASYDTGFMIIKSLFVVWLGTTAFYLSATLSQMIVSNVFVAGVIGFAAPLFPFYFVRFSYNILYNSFGLNSTLLANITNKLMLIEAPFSEMIKYNIAYSVGTKLGIASQSVNGMYPLIVDYYDTNILITAGNIYLGAMALFAAALLALCLYFYKKLVCYANYNDFIAFPKAAAAFAILGGICCALLAASFFKGFVIILIVFAVTFTVTFFVLRKISGRGGVIFEKLFGKK